MDLTTKLNQTAVYWAPALSRDVFGQDTFAAGVDLACRWQDKVEEFVNANGERELSAAVVYCEQPADPARVDARMYLGSITDLTAGEIADPTTVAGSHVVRAVSQSPSMNAGETLYKLWLGKG